MCNPQRNSRRQDPHPFGDFPSSVPRLKSYPIPAVPLALSMLSHCLSDWVSLGPKTTGRKWIEQKKTEIAPCKPDTDLVISERRGQNPYSGHVLFRTLSGQIWAKVKLQFRGRSIRSCQERSEALDFDDSEQLLCATCGALRFLFGWHE